MLKKISYVFEVLKKRGLGFFWTYFKESVWFDLRHGTSTSSRVTKDEQQINSDHQERDNGLLYVASFTSVTRNTVQIARKLLGPDRFQRSQFFDLGCGKGKALFVYAQSFRGQFDFPAVGIEYDPGLAQIAQDNQDRLKLDKDKVKVVADSATNLASYLQSETAVIYLYNSFQGETLRSVLGLLQSVPHVLIYVDPAEKDCLAEFGYTITHTNQGRYNADTWLVATSGLT